MKEIEQLKAIIQSSRSAEAELKLEIAEYKLKDEERKENETAEMQKRQRLKAALEQETMANI